MADYDNFSVSLNKKVNNSDSVNRVLYNCVNKNVQLET